MAAAGVVAAATEKTFPSIKKIKWTWTSDASGNANGVLTTKYYTGKCVLLTTVPGSQSPTDNYDMVIIDEDGVDVLGGGGQNRDTVTTEQVLSASLGAVADSKLELQITNAGGFKQGTVYLYLQ